MKALRSTLLVLLVLASFGLVACDGGGSVTGRTTNTVTDPATQTVTTSLGTRPNAHTVLGPTSVGTGGYGFTLLTGTSLLHVAIGDTAGHLFRISTAVGSSAHASVRLVGRQVALTLVGGGSDAVDVTLSDVVRWQIRLEAGVSTVTVSAPGQTLLGFAALQGISTLDMTVGVPSKRVVLTEDAGISTFALHLPRRVAIRVEAASGAGTISLFGTPHTGVSAGTTVTSGSPDALAGFTIQANAGIGSLDVDAR